MYDVKSKTRSKLRPRWPTHKFKLGRSREDLPPKDWNNFNTWADDHRWNNHKDFENWLEQLSDENEKEQGKYGL